MFFAINSHFVTSEARQCVRVVKEEDSKSSGVPPRRFESCHCRSACLATFALSLDKFLSGWCRPVAEDDAAGRPRRTSPFADGRAGVSPRMSDGEEDAWDASAGRPRG